MKLKGSMEKWLFPEDIKGKTPLILEFVEEKMQKSLKGVEYPVLYFMGRSGEFVGDIRVSGFKLTATPEVIEKYGDDTSAWVGKQFAVSSSDGKKLTVGL
jgi:hypothetical protein